MGHTHVFTPKYTILGPKIEVKMPIFRHNVRETPKHIRNLILALYQSHVDSKDLKFYCNEIPFLGPKWGGGAGRNA